MEAVAMVTPMAAVMAAANAMATAATTAVAAAQATASDSCIEGICVRRKLFWGVRTEYYIVV